MPSLQASSLQARNKSPSRDQSPSPRLPRNRSVRAFLPLNDEGVLSTRGQHLPVLLHHRSTNLIRKSSFFLSAEDNDEESGLRGSGELERVKSAAKSRNNSLVPNADARDSDSRSLDERRFSDAARAVLMSQQMRSMRLIGNSNPRYRWEQYWKFEDELKAMKKPIRKYYERNNSLIQQYVFIDRLLDSSLPHDLIQEYQTINSNSHAPPLNVPRTISEEPLSANGATSSDTLNSSGNTNSPPTEGGFKVKRTPKNIYKIPDERAPLLGRNDQDYEDVNEDMQMPEWAPEDETDSGDRIVTVAIYINLAANTLLLILKIIVTIMTSSVSVLAALVDAVLDFLSTAIVWTTTRLISTQDQYLYPAGRAKLEPIGVLVFSVIMITSFFQVALEGFNRMTSGEHVVVQLSAPAIAIMSATVVVKGLCWLWCRLIKNSSVQALAQDAVTDVVFNIFSIIFPLIGYYANIWWLDPLGGILLSFYVIYAWSQTSFTHIRNLSGAAATADERNILLYLTMRFAKTIKQIQGIQAYHAGDKLNVEVDIVLDEDTSLRDSHDLGESLQYVLESVPTVDRAFVHLDYAAENLPTHMRQT